MPYTTETANSEAPAMVCPICGKNFFDVHSFAAHMNEHSQEEKKRKAEEEKKKREQERNVDVDNLVALYHGYKSAYNAFEKALTSYENKYGGRVFPYSSPLQSILDDFFR